MVLNIAMRLKTKRLGQTGAIHFIFLGALATLVIVAIVFAGHKATPSHVADKVQATQGWQGPKSFPVYGSNNVDPTPIQTLSNKTAYCSITGACFSYVRGAQLTKHSGVQATLFQAKPRVGPKDFHSLAELALFSADAKQIVEIGWTVDKTKPDGMPRLFVYHWVDGKPTCYNGCGFVTYNYSGAPRPNQLVAVGKPATYKVLHLSNKWIFWYNNSPIGYFPDSLWRGRFTKAYIMQVFGEVAYSPTKVAYSQMGNGKLGYKPGSAYIKDVKLIGAAVPTRLSVEVLGAPLGYKRGYVTASRFNYGGPGY